MDTSVRGPGITAPSHDPRLIAANEIGTRDIVEFGGEGVRQPIVPCNLEAISTFQKGGTLPHSSRLYLTPSAIGVDLVKLKVDLDTDTISHAIPN